MRLALSIAAAALLAPSLAAQQAHNLDPDGNYVPSYDRRPSASPDNGGVPGDLIDRYMASNGSTSSGYAPRLDAPGQWFNVSGDNAEIFRTDDNGIVDATLPLTDVNDSWPGLDGSRMQLITVNAFDDTISSYDANTGAPIFRVPTPTAGPVGAAYDSSRDLYWYSDWTTNELVGLSASDLQGGVATIQSRFSTAGQITRIAGVAYNCLDDTLVSGGRDQGMQVAYSASSSFPVATWAVLGGSINDPQGCGLSPQSCITTTDFQDLETRIQQGTVGVRPGVFANGPVVTFINYCGSETRALVGHSAKPGRSIISGVLTCLDAASVVNGGRLFLAGSPPSGGTHIGTTGRAIQAGVIPSKTLSNLTFN